MYVILQRFATSYILHQGWGSSHDISRGYCCVSRTCRSIIPLRSNVGCQTTLNEDRWLGLYWYELCVMDHLINTIFFLIIFTITITITITISNQIRTTQVKLKRWIVAFNLSYWQDKIVCTLQLVLWKDLENEQTNNNKNKKNIGKQDPLYPAFTITFHCP